MSASADQVARAKALLAVCEGETYQQAVSLAGRKSNAAVSPLVSRFNKVGLSALETKHGGGPTIEYTQAEKERIVREFQRTPDRVDDGTATYSPENILQNLRVNFFKFSSFLFDSGKLLGLVEVVDRLIHHPVSVPAFLQGVIVKFTTQLQSGLKVGDLSFRGKYPELVGFASAHFSKLRS